MPYAIEAVTGTLKDLGTYLSPLVTGFEAVAGAASKIGGLLGSKDDDKLEFRMKHPEIFARGRALDAELARKRLFGKYGHGDEFVPDPSLLSKAGKQAAEGLVEGMASKAGDVDAAGGRMGAAAEAGARHALKSHSPSKVFEDIGLDTAEGFALGVGRGRDSVDRELDELLLAPARGGARGGGINAGGIAVHNTITVTAGANASPAEVAKAVGSELELRMPGALMSAFDVLNQRVGGGL
jgi:hypothetical protein